MVFKLERPAHFRRAAGGRHRLRAQGQRRRRLTGSLLVPLVKPAVAETNMSRARTVVVLPAQVLIPCRLTSGQTARHTLAPTQPNFEWLAG